MSLALAIVAFLFGAIIGSFLNVVIHRIPLDESIVFPASRCPSCRHQIRAFDNIPVLSWLILRGRCRDCREPISGRYPLIETANGMFYAAIYVLAGLEWTALLLAAVVSMLIALIYIDLDVQLLPDVIDLPGVAIGIVIGALAVGERLPQFILSRSLVESLLGAALGFGILFSISWLYRALRGVEGMGQGDFKMMAMIGAVSGWPALLPVLFLASITGAIFGIAIAVRQRSDLQIALPFGVFLGLASLAVIFFGSTLATWYLAPLS